MTVLHTPVGHCVFHNLIVARRFLSAGWYVCMCPQCKVNRDVASDAFGVQCGPRELDVPPSGRLPVKSISHQWWTISHHSDTEFFLVFFVSYSFVVNSC